MTTPLLTNVATCCPPSVHAMFDSGGRLMYSKKNEWISLTDQKIWQAVFKVARRKLMMLTPHITHRERLKPERPWRLFKGSRLKWSQYGGNDRILTWTCPLLTCAEGRMCLDKTSVGCDIRGVRQSTHHKGQKWQQLEQHLYTARHTLQRRSLSVRMS